MEIREKIIIKEKESHALADKDLHAQLRWKKAVDLDLYALYLKKDGTTGKVYFGSRGSKTRSPYIYLDQDAGVGDVGGDNVENMYFTNLSDIKHVLIVANIYGKRNAVFASFDGEVSVKSGSQELIVPLTAKEGGNWCVIAKFDNIDNQPKLTNINQVYANRPDITAFLEGRVESSTEKPKGFFGRLFGG